jgi:predicted nucleic acid-binding protein
MAMKAVFDSDILIDFLTGEAKADVELRRYSERLISVVSWAEVMIGAAPGDEEIKCREFLASFSVVPFDLAIADEAARIRRGSRLKLPDAVIWATAKVNGALLVTRNTSDFPSDDPFVRIPYSL